MPFQIALTFLAPALAIFLARRIALLGWLGPVAITYAIGMLLPMLLAALPGNGHSAKTADLILSVVLPLSLPLLLFTMNVRGWLQHSKPAALSFLFACIGSALSVAVVFTITTQLFASSVYTSAEHDPALMAGMMAAMYTGGTPNMAVVHQSLSGSPEVFLQLNAADMLLGGLWFLWLISFAKPMLGKLLPSGKFTQDGTQFDSTTNGTDYKFSGKDCGRMARLLALSAAGLGAALGLSLLLWGSIEGPFIMLLVTAFGVAVSLSRHPLFRTESTQGSYEMGFYLVLVFCCAMGGLVDPARLLSGALPTLLYVSSIMLLTLLIHLLLAKLAGIDIDTFLITHTAALFGPPFVPPVANALRNKAVLLSGLTAGLVGYAAGSYLGLGMAWLLGNF